jgi:DNA-binding NtrC family response regulator
MTRVLLIEQDNAMAQRFGLRCLEGGMAVVIAESVCEGVRVLASTPVSMIVADFGRFRLGVHEQAALFDRVAPGVPVIVTVAPDFPLETRVALEVDGFRVMPAPPEPEDLLKMLASA